MNPNITTPLFTAEGLSHWMAKAVPGDRVVYHRGMLSRDRADIEDNPRTREERKALSDMTDRAYLLYRTGLATLVQQRHDFEDYSYIIIALSKPARNPRSKK